MLPSIFARGAPLYEDSSYWCHVSLTDRFGNKFPSLYHEDVFFTPCCGVPLYEDVFHYTGIFLTRPSMCLYYEDIFFTYVVRRLQMRTLLCTRTFHTRWPRRASIGGCFILYFYFFLFFIE